MVVKSLIVCPHCGFDYDSTKLAYCPNCNFGNEKKNILINLSDKGLALPMGVKIAVLLTSIYAIYAVSDILFNQFLINILISALYLGVIYFWSTMIDRIERPVWFLLIVIMMYLPVLTLISLLLFL